MKKKNGISVIMVLHNEGESVKESLESIKGIADEILIAHDGPCKNNTLNFCKRYTKKIFIRPHKGFCEYHQAFLYKKANFNWILKLDSDESLSSSLKKNIRKLVKNDGVNAYSFVWPYWDGKEEITFEWPRKISLYRKDKISYLGFVNFGEPEIYGKMTKTNYKILHKPFRGDPTKWKTFYHRDLKHVLFHQAKDAMKNPSFFENFRYDSKEFPLKLKLRIKLPLLTSPLFGIVSFLKTFQTRELLKNLKIILITSIYSIIRSFYYGYYLFRLRRNPNWIN